MDVCLLATDTKPMIETNRLIRQKDNNRLPAGYGGGRHKIPTKGRKSGILSDSTRALHCLPPFSRKLSSFLMNCGIYFVFIPGIIFFIPRLNNSISPVLTIPG